jgi:hypothetical protein
MHRDQVAERSLTPPTRTCRSPATARPPGVSLEDHGGGIAVQAERLEDQGRLDYVEHLLDPGIRALAQIINEYKPPGTLVIVDDVVRDIDTLVKQVRYTGWNETQEGDRTVRRELRMMIKKYALPVTGPLFDNAYASRPRELPARINLFSPRRR